MGCNHNCESCGENCKSKDLAIEPNKNSNFKKIISVVSGKGGVGKSLVTSLLAVELNKKGYKVGILDADITGPSIPKYFGIKGKTTYTEKGLNPGVSKGNIEVMSTNLLVDNETDPVCWRGPVIASCVQQFFTDVYWGDLDVLLIDMPPGTGDVPLTVFQSLHVDAIAVVTSPQELVSMIVEKAVKMAGLMNKKVLGLVENMSYFHCPDNNKDYKIFGNSHIEEVAENNNLEVLGRIPIDPAIADLSDKGEIENYSNDYLKELVQKIEEL